MSALYKLTLIVVVAASLLAITVSAAEIDNQSATDLHDQLGKGLPFSTTSSNDIDSTVQAIADLYRAPGLQAAIIYGDSVVWTTSYGYMDADRTVPVTDSTLFLVASISKTVLATALLQCVENGLVDLDEDINTYLPFAGRVENPTYPGTPITCRMILSHVSSINANDTSWTPDMVYDEDWDGDWVGYLEDYLVAGGPTYAGINYLPYEPGTHSAYSNYAFCLLAVVVQNVTGIAIETYVKDSIFSPLDIYEASWHIDSLDVGHIAVPLGACEFHSVGEFPHSVIWSDLNGDGYDDLVSANFDSDDLSVVLNNGDGTMQIAVNYPAGDGPTCVTAALLNDDAIPDLAVSTAYADAVSVLIGNGDGTFQTASSYTVDGYPWAVAAGDFDNDGYSDLATANGSSNTVSIILNNKHGAFGGATDYSVGNGPRSVFAADLNSDGATDLAVANRLSNNVCVLLNNGDGTFAASIYYSVGGLPQSVYGGDIDGDLDIDLAVANSTSDDISILRNNGDGTYQPAETYAVGDYPLSIVMADLDNDGDNDLAVCNRSAWNIHIMNNSGDGTFVTNLICRTGTYPYAMSGGDRDNDGDFDLATVSQYTDSLCILPNRGDGTFELVRVGHVSHPLWPIGTLKTSASQLGHHLATLPTYGAYKGNRVLDSVTVDQIMTNHYPAIYTEPNVYGLGWKSMGFTSGEVWGHDGGLPGCVTVMFVDPVYRNGVVVLVNENKNWSLSYVFNALWDYSLDIDGDGIPISEDNCPITYNPGQEDSNGNDMGDACEESCCVGLTGNVDGDGSDICDIGDLTALIGYLFIPPYEPPVCMEEANVDGTGTVDIGDLTALIGYLFIPPFTEPSPCQ